MIKYLPDLVRKINLYGSASLDIPSGSLNIFLREGRDPEIGSFNFFEIQWPQKLPPKRLKCFVGHRFAPKIEAALRQNLRYVFEPSGIDLTWSGRDLKANGFFDEIISDIRSCDFCIFDNRGTRDRPNVYIEAGIAYALKRPFLFLNCLSNSVKMPTNLEHIQCINYRTYRDLTRRLYFNLPAFLRDRNLVLRPHTG